MGSDKTLNDSGFEERHKRLAKVSVLPEVHLREGIRLLDAGGAGVLLLRDDRWRLTGLLTDGDIRRAILQGKSMRTPCSDIATPDPVVGYPELTPREALILMDSNPKGIPLDHLPLVDDEGVLRDLILRRDCVGDTRLPVSAVIMAGGFGTRLRPLTDTTPKPMLRIGDHPLLELTIRRIGRLGIRRVNVSTHFQPEIIRQHFGDGSDFGIELNYINEDQPLGTAGALGLLSRPEETLLVMNGDILTQLDYRVMLAFHREHESDVTIAVRQYDVEVPYGVVECDGVHVTALSEKPTYNFFVNAGVYLLEPGAYEFVPPGQHFDMPDLIAAMMAAGKRVVSFPVVEYWLDIGQHVDYERAQKDIREGKVVI